VVNTRVYKRKLGYFYDALAQKLYFDVVYDAVFIRPFMFTTTLLASMDLRVIDGAVNGLARGWVVLASASWRFDSFAIDGLVNGVATASRAAGTGLRRLQTGRLQSYQRLVFSAVVLIMICLVVYVVVKGA